MRQTGMEQSDGKQTDMRQSDGKQTDMRQTDRKQTDRRQADTEQTNRKKNKMGIWVGCGIFCILSVFISVWYAVTFQDSRLVAPMDFRDYVFRAEDLPMLVSVSLTCIYVLAVVIGLFVQSGKRRGQAKEAGVTRRIHPRLGLLGMLGFLGFVGFSTYPIDGTVFPFAFFLFFGFFYEGKMSETFMDERFRENVIRARLKAYRITVSMMFAALIILCRGKLFGSLEYTLIAVIITLSLALALGIFLSEYLLYRYDHDDQMEDGEE